MKREFELIVRELRDPLLLATTDGRILAANAVAADALAMSSVALEGLALDMLAVEPSRLAALLDSAAGGAPESFAVRTLDGRRFVCDPSRLDAETLLLRLSGGTDAGSRTRAFDQGLSRIHGVTGGDADEQTLEEVAGATHGTKRAADQGASHLARLQAFTAALAQAITPGQLAEVVVDVGMAATSSVAGGLWLRSEDGANASLVRSVGRTGPVTEKFQNVPLAVPGRMPILDAIRTATPIWIESCRELDDAYPALRAQFSNPALDDAALACVPLLAQGRCIGGLVYVYAGPRRFGEDERTFIQVLSWYSTQALDRARLHAAERKLRELSMASERRMAFLADAGALLASSLDYRATLASVVEAAVPRVADWCIAEFAEEPDGPGPVVAAHVDPAKVALLLEVRRRGRNQSGGFLGIPAVIRSGTSELVRDISTSELKESTHEDPEIFRLCLEAGLASSIVVPMRARGRVLGAIVLVSADRARLFDEKDLEMAEELGNRAGVAVDNARLYSDAREANRRKDEFLAMLGHELRNPLAPILTALELMRLRGDDQFHRERAIIDRQLQHVIRLVDDLLDVSRITRGKIEIRREPVEISLVVGKAVEMVSPLLEQRQHELIVSVPPSDLTVLADQGRLAQVVANVLINAAKFTEPRGRISLDASTEGSTVAIRIRDSGIGIAPEALSDIFGPFVQQNRSLDRPQGGLGIGLTIVKSLMELHGGSVSARSAGLGRGSEFVLRLPIVDEAMSARESLPMPPARSPETPARGLRILIVDDNPSAASMLAEVFDTLGYQTAVAFDGPSALTVAPSFEPELALLDIGLPVMDGYELARRLREQRVPAKIRLVALTGYGQESDIARSRDAGFDAHVVKPVNLETLLALVTRLEKADEPT